MQSFVTQTNGLHSNIIIAACVIAVVANLHHTSNLDNTAAFAMLWTIAQVATAIILTCCPLLRPVFEKFIPRRCTQIKISSPLCRHVSQATLSRPPQPQESHTLHELIPPTSLLASMISPTLPRAPTCPELQQREGHDSAIRIKARAHVDDDLEMMML